MTTVPYYKICPKCRVEHTHATLRCADCDVELVHPGELAPGAAPVELPPAAQLDCVRIAPLPWIRALSEGLEQRGVTHRVEPAGSDDAPEGQKPEVFGEVQLFGLYVEATNAALARELDGTIAAQVLPDEAPELAEGESDDCPACGTPLMAHAIECSDCGLVLG